MSDQEQTELMIKVAEKELNNAFKAFDVDQSGYLEKNEFGQLIKRLASAFHVEEPSFTDIDKLSRALDVNGDGKITKEEFHELIVEIVTIIKEERAKK